MSSRNQYLSGDERRVAPAIHRTLQAMADAIRAGTPRADVEAQATVRVSVPGVTEVLEGAHRPGHFDGVATVVARLFNQVQPHVAVFGQKDYQQLAVIRYMVRDLAFPVALLAGETQRESDGLAMSSRNQYLSTDERPVAATIRQALVEMRASLLAGASRADVERDARKRLETAGFVVDYAELRRLDLTEPQAGDAGPLVGLVAARLGRTRLIDNLVFETGEIPPV
jgi:pantoate--beta-alanine ligase